jgi:hypothetical protein
MCRTAILLSVVASGKSLKTVCRLLCAAELLYYSLLLCLGNLSRLCADSWARNCRCCVSGCSLFLRLRVQSKNCRAACVALVALRRRPRQEAPTPLHEHPLDIVVFNESFRVSSGPRERTRFGDCTQVLVRCLLALHRRRVD